MTSFTILACTACLILLGRAAFHEWFNHFSIYSALWGVSLFLFELRLIKYYPTGAESWVCILGGSASFFVACLTVVMYRKVRGYDLLRPETTAISRLYLQKNTERELTKILWIMNVITLGGALQHLYIMAKIAGGLVQMIVLTNAMYSFRIEYGVPGGVPYVSSFALGTSILAGALTAIAGRPKLAAVGPIVTLVIDAVALAGRATLVVGGSCFLTGYFATRYFVVRRAAAPRAHRKVRAALSLLVVAALVIGGMEFVRENRGGDPILQGSTRSLNTIRGAFLVSPALYHYVAGNFAVLNQYFEHGGEKTPWGANTFGAVYHLLSKLGSTTTVSWYQKFYATPTISNTGTYLREAHADFGMTGVFLLPYILGLVTSAVWFKLNDKYSLALLILLGALFTVVVMSLFVIITRGGDLIVGGAVGAVVGAVVDRRTSRKRVAPDELPLGAMS